MMRQMREHTKWVMIAVAVSFVALMVFEWGMDLSGRSNAQASGGELGRINGEAISYEQYLTIYRNLYQQQEQAQEDPITPAQNKEIESAAWDQIVMETLIRQELKRRGLFATNAEIKQAARYAPPPELYQNELFLTDGRFDLAKYHQFLSSPGMDQQLLLQLESYYRDAIPRSKLIQQVTSGVFVSDNELWRLWRDRTETARVRYLVVDPATAVPDAAVSVSDREIASYYDGHDEEFRQAARATVGVAVLDKTPTAADTAASRARALRVRSEIAAGGDFAEIAKRESSDKVSAERGGSLGSFTKGQMVPAFDQAVWSLPIGRPSEPVQTQFGFHIIEVQKREGETAEARHILIPIERSEENADALAERADSLESLTERMPLAAAAPALGLATRMSELVKELPFVPGVGRVDEAADWAFGEGETGDVSPLFETEAAYYIVELTQKTPARKLTLKEATPTIRSIILADKKLEKARELARNAVDQVRARKSLEQVAAEQNLELHEAGPFTRVDFVSGIGRANAVIGAAFGLKPGQTSGTVEAERRLFIVQLIERQEADRKAWEQQKEEQRVRAQAALEQERWAQFIADLKEQAEIADNREKVLGPGPADAASR